jgi:hypothetical protein
MADTMVPLSEITVPLGEPSDTMSEALDAGNPTELASGMAEPGESPLEETSGASGHGADSLDKPDASVAPSVARDAADDGDWIGWWRRESDETAVSPNAKRRKTEADHWSNWRSRGTEVRRIWHRIEYHYWPPDIGF